MPLPPEILKLKRKRNEEPVDLLYIQHEGPQPKKSLTELKYLFERVPQNASSPPERILDTSTTQVRSSSNDGPRVPTVRATLPGEENEPVGPSAPRSSSTQNPPISTHNETSSSFQDTFFQNLQPSPRPERPRPPPKRFHITQETMAQFHHRRAANIRIHKRDQRLSHSVPVFSERVQDSREAMEMDEPERDRTILDPATTPSYISNLASPPNVTTTTTPSPRKRPIITPAEKIWQEKTWATPASLRATPPAPSTAQASLVTTQREYDALKLAYELQKFEEERAQAPRANLKYPPKPPPRRYQDRIAPPSSSMDINPPIPASPPDAPFLPAASASDDDSDSDYVIDLYKRKANPDPLATNSPAATAPAHGFLVIEPDQQILWEACGEDDEDADADAYDSEDSNAEGASAHDYPDRADLRRLWGRPGEWEFEDEGEDDVGFSSAEDEHEEGFSDEGDGGGAVGWRKGGWRAV